MAPSTILWWHHAPCASITPCLHHPSSSSSPWLQRGTKTEVFRDIRGTRLRPAPNSLHQWGRPALLLPTKSLKAEPGCWWLGVGGWPSPPGALRHQVRLGKVWGATRRRTGAAGLALAPQSCARSLPAPAPCPHPLPA